MSPEEKKAHEPARFGRRAQSERTEEDSSNLEEDAEKAAEKRWSLPEEWFGWEKKMRL